MNSKKLWLALALSPLCAVVASTARAADNDSGGMQCEMTFDLSGWSVIYKTADGHGTVTCDNGQSMKVKLSAKGGGLTVGKYKLENGHGKFSGVTDIKNVLGTYANATAHAGVVESSRATAMTKGAISLALTGTGEGWNIGAGFSGFTISEAK